VPEGERGSEKSSPKNWFTVREAADYLGVSQPTIFRWMKDGLISFYKIGGSTRFSKEGLDALVEKNTGQKEAEAVQGKCAACGHHILVDGRLQTTGLVYFRPVDSRFWSLREPMVPTRAKVCASCGYIQIHADTTKLGKVSQKAATIQEEPGE